MKKIYAEIKNVFESNLPLGILYTVGVLAIAILIFLAGILVGFRKASFGHAWEEHYYENFGMHTGPLDTDDLPNAHGAIGRIIKTELPNIIVQDNKDNIEKIISISDDTQIHKGSDNIDPTALMLNDFIIVVGQPNEKGIIDSRFIRVVPNPESLKQ